MNADVRNLLAFPSSRLTDFQSSPALNTAYMGNTLLPVSRLGSGSVQGQGWG